MKWISVKDRMPQLGVETLFTDTESITVGHLINNHKIACYYSKIDFEDITHWLPLPKPPEGVK
ncbi:MAG: DUF551 domain-containing protein [Candidatus Babeliales bacterium]